MATELLKKALDDGVWRFTPAGGGHAKEIHLGTSTDKHARGDEPVDDTASKKPRVAEDTPATTMWKMPATETVLTQANMVRECINTKILDLSTTGKVIVDEYCFAGHKKLTKVILPRTAVLKEGAFFRCPNLARVTFVAGTGGDVTLGDSAFDNCISLSKVDNMPQRCNYGNATFKGCVALTGTFILGGPEQPELPQAIFYGCHNLEAITLLPGTVSIGSSMCQYCNTIKEVLLSHPIQKIGDAAFSDCRNCSKVIFEEESTCAEEHVTFGKEAFSNCRNLTTIENMPSSYTLGQSTFAYCHALTGIFAVGGPSQPCVPGLIFEECNKVDAVTFFDGTRTIGRKICFACTTLSLLVIPNTVDTIHEYAFAECINLKEVVCGGEALRSVEAGAFRCCTQLLKITFDTHTPLVFGNSAFSRCIALQEFIVPTMTPKLPVSMFFDCTNLKKVVLNAVLDTIGACCFHGCDHLESCNFDDATQLTILGASSFAYTGLRSIDLNSTTITAIHERAFQEMPNLTTLVLPKKLQTIGTQLCMNCTSLKELVFPASLQKITSMACAHCTALTRVRIEGGRNIGEKCFVGCTALKEIVVAGHGTWTSV